MRDLSAIGSKIVLILYPAGSSSSKAVLRDWDLWGPLVACLGLAVVLSVNGTFLCTSLSLSLSTLFDFQLPLIKMTDARLLLVFFFFLPYNLVSFFDGGFKYQKHHHSNPCRSLLEYL